MWFTGVKSKRTLLGKACEFPSFFQDLEVNAGKRRGTVGEEQQNEVAGKETPTSTPAAFQGFTSHELPPLLSWTRAHHWLKHINWLHFRGFMWVFFFPLSSLASTLLHVSPNPVCGGERAIGFRGALLC